TDGRAHVDVSTEPARDAACHCQPQTGAAEFSGRGAVDLAELIENVLEIGLFDADSRILDFPEHERGTSRFAGVSIRRRSFGSQSQGYRALPGELHRIRQ